MSPTDPGPGRLQALNPDQEALLASLRDEWLRVGVATGPADRPAAEEGVRQAYRAAGLPSPGRMVWLGSPLAGALAACMLCVPDLSGHVPDRYWAAVREQLQGQLRASAWVQPSLGPSRNGERPAADRFGTPIGDQVQQRIAEPVRSAVLRGLSDRLGRSARISLWQLVERPVRRGSRQLGWQLHALIRRSLEPVLWSFVAGDDRLGRDDDLALPQPLAAVWGQHDADWLVCGAALRAIAPGVLHNRGLDGVMRAARSAGWWWPFERLVILTERPTTLQRDAQGLLHRADGPAIAYPDGVAFWAWHGVEVPRQVIERPERLTVPRIRGTVSEVVREVMLERYGLGRFLRDAGAERVSHDGTGTLWSADLGDERLVAVEVRNSTPEPDGRHTIHWLRVPPEVRTAREAVAWTFGLSAGDYRPIIET